MSFLIEAAELTAAQIRYQEYLQSDAWKRIRAERLCRGVWRGKRVACEWCGGFQWYQEMSLSSSGVQWRTTIDIHHLSYERRGHELYTDLMILCRDCHQRIHTFIYEMESNGFEFGRVLERLHPYCLRRMYFNYQCLGLAVHRMVHRAFLE